MLFKQLETLAKNELTEGTVALIQELENELGRVESEFKDSLKYQEKCVALPINC